MSREGRRISYQLADAFTEVPGGGNRVALVLDARGLTTEEMQQVAAKLGQPQAAFVTHREGSAFEVRFFAANGEVEFSGHAAVALAVALSREVESSSDPRKLYFRTIGESLLVEVADRRATVQSPSPRFRDPLPGKPCKRSSR